ncbi:MAG: carbohydrate ABC transporter permease [Spirochaetales bacterium]|nr:carbohydrate ABC transporter permease [Spirochaetales bacterium]
MSLLQNIRSFKLTLKQRKMGLYLTLIICSLFFLLPIYVLLVTSFKGFAEVSEGNMWALPLKATFAAFEKAFTKLGPSFINSLILTVPATLISALLGSLNGYILSKWRFKGANLIFVLMLFGMFIPYQSILIPLVQFLQKIGLYGNLIGLIIVHIIYGLPITTLIFRNYYSEIPDELIEAAHVDGQGIMGTYLYIIFPISLPAFVVVIIWQFTNIWNEFLFAITITQNPEQQPVTVALQDLSGTFIKEWNVQMAGAFLAALPTLLIYIILGKYFIRGLLAGSVKG